MAHQGRDGASRIIVVRVRLHILPDRRVFSCEKLRDSPGRRAVIEVSRLNDGLLIHCRANLYIPVVLRGSVDSRRPSSRGDGLCRASAIIWDRLEAVLRRIGEVETLHSGSFPSSIARRLGTRDTAALAAEIVLLILLWPGQVRISEHCHWIDIRLYGRPRV